MSVFRGRTCAFAFALALAPGLAQAQLSPGQFRFSVGAQSVTEGAGEAIVTVERVGGSLGAVFVTYSAQGGNARVGADYTPIAGRLEWADGDASPRTFSVPITDDGQAEPDRAFTYKFDLWSAGTGTVNSKTHTVTIQDDDTGPGKFRFSTVSQTVPEGIGEAMITVERVGGSAGSVTVSYSAQGGSARLGADYVPVAGQLEWADGDSSPKSFAVPVTDDVEPEPARSFTYKFDLWSSGTGTIESRTHTVTISDDDALPLPADAGECLVSLDPNVCARALNATMAQQDQVLCLASPLDAGCLLDDVFVAVLGEYSRDVPGDLFAIAQGDAEARERFMKYYTPQVAEQTSNGTPATIADKNWTGTLRGPFRSDKPVTEEGPGVDASCPTGSNPAGVQECAASRVYYVHEPAGYLGLAEPEALPLVVYLHGCGQTAIDAAVGTRWSQLADEKRFLVAYPEQRTPGFNNSYTNQGNSIGCWNWYDPAQGQGHYDFLDIPFLGPFLGGYSGNEPRTIADIIGDVADNWNVDRNRIYVIGASAGANMAVAMGITYADRIAAIGSMAGCAYPDCVTPPEAGGVLIGSRWSSQGRTVPVPLFAGQGTADTLSPAPATELLVHEWLVANDFIDGLPDASVSRLPAATFTGKAEGDGHGYDYRLDRWMDGRGCPVVERYLVYGIGHTYPNGDPAGSYTNEGGPDATRAAYEFFEGHTLAGAMPPGC